jgi:dTMP kinase
MLPVNKGIFITFEGLDGCGKTTQSTMLYQYLRSLDIPVDLTREVGGTNAAERVREILLYQDLLPTSELLLIMAARYDHVHKRIKPKLEEGAWVICDRFVDSTACYQGENQEGYDKIYQLHAQIISLMPDITFFIDVNPNLALNRALQRGNNNKFEDRDFSFHQNCYNAFQFILKKFPNRIVKIEATNLTIQQIHEEIVYIIKAILVND